MNREAINKVLLRKLEDWLFSITDEELKKRIKKDVIFTGGCIASMLLKEKINDYDIYFRTKSTTLAVARYYIKKFNEQQSKHTAFVLDGAEDLNDFISNNDISHETVMYSNMTPDRIKIIIPSDGVAGDTAANRDDVETLIEESDEATDISIEATEKYKPIFLSTNAITLSNKIQIVIRFYGEPSQIHENYDFIHATNYWTVDEKLKLKADAMESLLSKHLYYSGSKYPLCSVIRTRKFLKRGWHINAGQYLKMCFQLSELNLKDINVLEDQLFGVDTVYFANLVAALRSKAKGDENFIFNSGYICTLVDRIFG